MDLTQGTVEHKNARAKKMMLWFGIISMAMMFAGLTSAYVVSKSRPDWLKEFQIPQAFYISTIAILLSSITIHMAKRAIKKEASKNGTYFLTGTLLLGIAFIFFQFKGFGQIIAQGYYFTGSESSITTSFLYAITLTHIVHVFAGIIVLTTIFVKHLKGSYNQGKTLGLELGVTFWHFLDFLWLYLILFFYFFR
ncbi:heme-copper oxidase subunit III [Leptobacterium sp. I13]|uniref:cytochrome c oxidase subunit 3 n=1 Tax=Leptobacterium meishanense TaxID=3128904 RepID=UPI0030EC66AA